MSYKCKKCGAEITIQEKIKACPFCGLPISDENNASRNAVDVNAMLEKITREYDESGDSRDVKTAISEWDSYKASPNFNQVWRRFIITLAGSAVTKKDKELLPILKNHARDFDSMREESDLFLTLLKTHPKLGTINDWEELIRRAHGDEEKFGVILDSILYCIVKEKNKSFAVEIFNLFFSKKDEWANAGRQYIRAILSNDDIATDIFPISAFNAPTRRFAKNLKAYCKKYLDGDHSIALEQTKVWENYTAAEQARKKKNIIIAAVSAAVAVCIAVAVLIVINLVNTSTVAFTVDKVIEVSYGDEPREFLADYFVSYKKNSGESITEPIHDKMSGYDPERVGEQTVEFSFKGTSVTVTLIVKKQQLAAPQLTQYGSYVRWDAVPHAQSYAIYINASLAETTRTTSLSYDLSTNTNFGELNITVRAFTDDVKYDASPASAPLTVTKLEEPKNIVYSGGMLSWSAVTGAVSYELTVNGTPYTVTSPECAVNFITGDNEVTINAKGADDSVIHSVTHTTIFYSRLDPITGMSYQNGNVYWTAGDGARSYAIYVNGEYWKDLSRNYFSVVNDGFADLFSDGIHEIGIVCKSATMGIEASELRSFIVAVGNRISMNGDTLSWTSLGQGATYFVTVNGETHTLTDSYIPLSLCEWSVGNNTVEVNARLGGVEYICETVTVVKHKAPQLAIHDSGWITDNSSDILYSVNGGAWTATLPDVSTLTAGEYTVVAKHAVSSATAFEIESETVELRIKRGSAPTIYVSGGMLLCSYDSTEYKLRLYYAPQGGSLWTQIDSLDEIINPGEYQLRAALYPIADAFPDYSGFLSSDYSAVINVSKPAAPSVIYDKETHILTSDPPGAQFYYTDEDGVEHQITGNNTSNLPGGVFLIYARINATEDGMLNSANTPEHKRISVFNLDITMTATALQNQNICNLSFEGCEEISELTFTYKIDYYGVGGVYLGTMDRSSEPPITISNKVNGGTIWTQLTYFHPQLSGGVVYNDIISFKITATITFGTETLVREAVAYK